ncbi:DNA-binding HxlR family transcriptional regulator [Rhizomicrobium palustre]|uniref:DNA-binding HxlR family transcriptional regulator n=1 Tax=Rhizomicrobium palustre TaxID=189966 RepID=A0A846N2X6_9PROT|nr:helix-turn-helix domain-containing protein [Rhizomicrobium palustre]NIK89641.1 DNA-binding HxlR family transcriptional regulator [Rhizomicrobium palustre]
MNCASTDTDQFLCATCTNRQSATESDCPARWFFLHFADKWTLPVLGLLNNGPLRFSQFRKSLTPISERMLILALKKLERFSLIEREESNTTAAQAAYRLTPEGRSLLEHMGDLYLWMRLHETDILAAMTADTESKQDRKNSSNRR